MLLKTGKPLRGFHPIYLACIYGIALFLGGLNSLTFFGPFDVWVYIFRAGYVFTCVGALIFLGVIGSTLRGSLPDLERSRLRVIFVGALLGLLIPTLSTVLTSSFQLAIPYNFALVPTVFFPLSVAYALLKYSLFDLGNSLKVGLSRIALTAFLLAMYALVVFLLAPWVSTESDLLSRCFSPSWSWSFSIRCFVGLKQWWIDMFIARIMTLYVCKRKSVCFSAPWLHRRRWLRVLSKE